MAEKLTFSRDLYSADALEATVKAFGELATFKVDTGDLELSVDVAAEDPEEEEMLVDEFCNYLLSETIIRSRTQDRG